MDGQQTAEPPCIDMETATDDGSVGALPCQSDGTEGARSKHGALVRRKYKCGAASSENGHGYLTNQEGTETEEEGDKTPQHALPVESHNIGENKARRPPE